MKSETKALKWPNQIWKLAAILLTAASLMTVLTLAMTKNANAQTSDVVTSQNQETANTSASDCPKQGALDPNNGTWEDISGPVKVNGLGVPVGAEVKMKNGAGYLVACYKTLVEGYFGPARITGGAFGFQQGEQVNFEVDGVAIQLAEPYTYHGDMLGRTTPELYFTVEDWQVDISPIEINLTATETDTAVFVPITATNVLSTPAYFKAFMTFGDGCIYGFGDPSMILRPGQSMNNHIYVNLSCSWKQGGAHNSLILEEIRPLPITQVQRVFLPIEVEAVNPPWIEVSEPISETYEYVSEPKLTWNVFNPSRFAYDYYTTLDLGVASNCYTKPAFKNRLIMGETQTIQVSLTPSCMGSGTFTGTLTLTKEVPISVEPPVLRVPVTVTVLPNPWEVVTTAPLKITSGEPYTFTMSVKNISERKRLGAASVTIKHEAFNAPAEVTISDGEVNTMNIGPYIESHWAFEIEPGAVITLTATVQAKDVFAITNFQFVVGWQAPDLKVGGHGLEIHPQEQSEGDTKIYLPSIQR